jgi:hypothetical protein
VKFLPPNPARQQTAGRESLQATIVTGASPLLRIYRSALKPRVAEDAPMADVVVVDFPAEGECGSVVARPTPDGWRYRWVYNSVWDDVDAGLLGIVPHSESAEQPSVEAVLPKGWAEMRPGLVHADWAAWFRDALAAVDAGLGDDAERRRFAAGWRLVLGT